MKKITVKKIESLLKNAKRKHDKEQKNAVARAKNGKYTHKVSEFNNCLGYSDMPWKPRLQVFKGCNGKAVLNPIDLCATSYDWWKFVTEVNGKVIFNNYNYSVTTRGHQNSVKSLLKALGVKIDVVVNCKASLSSSEWEQQAVTNIHKDLMLAEYKLTKSGLRDTVRKDLESQVKENKAKLKALSVIKFNLSKVELKALQLEVINREEARLEENREEAKAYRAARKAMAEENKSELESLEPVELYNKYDTVNSLKSI